MKFNSLSEYFNIIPKQLHFILLPELSCEHNFIYEMDPKYGKGTLIIMHSINKASILIGNFTPQYDFEKISKIDQNYIEINKFDTTSSSYKIGKRASKRVNIGISCYINNKKLIHVFCEKNKVVKFVKIVLTEDYFNSFLKNNHINSYRDFKKNFYYVSASSSFPELSFIFNQIETSKLNGIAQKMYLESKILELLSFIAYKGEIQNINKEKNCIRLSNSDKLLLRKCIKLFKNNLSEYPSLDKLANTCCMSSSKFLLTFKYLYGTSPYQYLKNMRMEAALDLLLNSEYKITFISRLLGYKNSGHFAKLFKQYYCMTPNEYRHKNLK
ncbi:HTH araC/xylS-type domain-containing protein [Fusobacterium necrophorum subsp. funduliforme]|uniref:helix-turn-helix domain-containing protein n=1 Tax=Fusobacterium necrophorum TaxID=859 RepID=UPI00370E1259